MKYIKNIGFIILILISYGIHAQCIAPAEPYLYAAPNTTGDGQSYSTPMDLQIALNTIQPGYTLWLLDGVYNGRYIIPSSTSGTATCPITISSYPGEWAIIDGNNNAGGNPNVLSVRGAYIIFQNFEITHLGTFTRDQDDIANFESCGGISHLDGENCKFLNLVIHDNPGTGFSSWKQTAGTEIYGCLVYNNGWYESSPPPNTRYNHGPAFYVQNSSEQIRLMENNIVFNNFSFAYEIWSACPGNCPGEYVKNVTVNNSSIFNNAHPFHNARHQVLVASADDDGINIPRDIIIDHNQIYNNHDLVSMSGYGGAIRLNQLNSSNAMQNITITNNFMIGKNQTLVIGNVESLTYTNNFLVTGLININGNSQFEPYPNWTFNHNTYYTKWPYNEFMRENGGNPRRSFVTWQAAPFFQDLDSEKFMNAGAQPVQYESYTHIVQNNYKPNLFKVAVFDGNEDNINVDFYADNYDIPEGTPYDIIDVENYPNIMSSGSLESNGIVNFQMNGTTFIPPSGFYDDWTFEKTPSTFGVFLIEFDIDECIPDYVLQDITEAGNTDYLALNSIIASNNYVIEPDANILHQAGLTVILKPGVHIKFGAKYLAKIEDCTSSELRYVGENHKNVSKKSTNKPDAEEDSLIIFPNPTSNSLTIKSKVEIVKWNLKNILGKEQLTGKVNNKKYEQIDMTPLSNGIYFLSIKLVGGEIITKQIIKK